MEPIAVVYDPSRYHFHLLYDAVLSLIGFAVVLWLSRWLAPYDPGLRVRLFALAIGLPILGELVAFAAYQMRPAPHTPMGQALLRFHERCGVCTLMDQPLRVSTQPRWVLSALLVLVLISLIRCGVGNLVLGHLTAGYPSLSRESHPGLHRHLMRVAARCGIPLPRIAVSPHGMPFALTFGIRRPTIIVSRGLLSRFSRAEVEAVLAHELAHTVRRDNLWNWLMTLLRDALFFLPTSHLAWQQMVMSQEEACDDLAIQWTRRPLDLARSLLKVWQQPRPRDLMLFTGMFLITPFFQRSTAVERRIERILLTHYRVIPAPPRHRTLLASAAVGVVLLLYALPIAMGS